MQKPLVVGLVGLYCSGKDTAASFFAKQGFRHYSLSDILREEMSKRGIRYRSRDDLIRAANAWRKKYGRGFLAELASKKIDKAKAKQVVISSIRNVGEVETFKDHARFFLIVIASHAHIRYSRAVRRGKIDDKVSFSEFLRQEMRERRGSRNQQQLDAVITLADFTIENNSTRQAFLKKFRALYELIQQRQKQLMHIVLLGPQGSGKGTQARLLTKRFRLHYIETGRLLRAMVATDPRLGRKIDALINKKGALVPDAWVNRLIEKELARVPKGRGILFDGYPRTLRQARFLDRLLKRYGRSITHVVYLPIKDQTTLKRLTKRRMCERCGRIFIEGVTIKKNAKQCPVCHGTLFRRADDYPAAIRERLKLYHKRTNPIVQYYQKRGIVMIVDAEPPIPVVFKNIIKHIQ